MVYDWRSDSEFSIWKDVHRVVGVYDWDKTFIGLVGPRDTWNAHRYRQDSLLALHLPFLHHAQITKV
jgi:hypothetical protein